MPRLLPMAGFGDRLFHGEFGQALLSAGALNGSTATKSTLPAMRVLRSSVGNRVMARMPDSPASQLLPVVGLAGAERGDDAHAGDDDDRAAELVVRSCHARSPQPTRLDQSQAFAAPVADAGDDDLVELPSIALFDPGRVAGREQLAVPSATAASAMFMANCGSNPWPRWCRWRAREGRRALRGMRAPRRSRVQRRWRRK